MAGRAWGIDLHDLTQIDLFSGIGGFALAAQWAGFRTIAFCEIDPFCQEVLKERFGATPNPTSARQLRAEQLENSSQGKPRRGTDDPVAEDKRLGTIADTLRQRRQQKSRGTLGDESPDEGRTTKYHNITSGHYKSPILVADTESMGRRNGITKNIGSPPGKINPSGDKAPILIPDIFAFDGSQFGGSTLLTGGVPCQPASIAGQRKGTTDDRWLWPEALRVLFEVRPAWAIFENPTGILTLESGVVFEDLLAQMEGEGYEVQPIVIPACAVNAPHRRDRVWIIAYAQNNAAINVLSSQDPIGGRNGRRNNGDTSRMQRTLQTQGSDSDAQNSLRKRPPSIGRKIQIRADGKTADSIGPPDSDAPDTSGQRLSGDVCRKLRGVSGKTKSFEGGQLGRGIAENEQWEEPWPEVATRLCRVDARVPNRVDRLKALGNAIVPQVAYEIIKAIAEIERGGLR